MSEKRTPRILVVDDNEANRALARETLEDEGYEVILASNGTDGVLAYEQHRPDCVLLDVRMPDLDGFAVCNRIRALPGGADTPVLFLTALRDVDTFDRSLAAGGSDFLTKPVRPTELVVRVESALKLRQLGIELREHYELLRQQRDDLLRLQLQKERLTTFVVHDLKNPVNTMDLHAQLLLRHRDLPQSAVDSAKQIRAEARLLTAMILNLLDLAKADEGQLLARPAEVDLAALVNDVLTDLAANADAHGVRLESALELTHVSADPDLFRRALSNLVDNAIRYSPKGTCIRVIAQVRVDGFEIRVTDAGTGVPPDMRDKIFDPFVQGEPDVASRRGRGLGLTFCKVVAEAHGGRIWVEDGTPGAVFCMRIPHGQ